MFGTAYANEAKAKVNITLNTFAISLKMVCHTCEGRYPFPTTRLDSRLRGNDIWRF